MTFDSRSAGEEPWGAEDGSHGDDAARRDARASATRRTGGRGLAVTAGEDEFVVGGVDVAQARSALAQLGAQGSGSLSAMSPREVIAVLSGLQKLSAAVAAVQARTLVQLEAAVTLDSVQRGESPRQAVRIARAEASAALKASPSAAGQSMASCRRLVQSMPGLLTALADGRMVPAAGHVVGRVLGPATPRQRSQVDEVLTAHLGSLEGCGPQEWGDEAERVLHALDPGGAAERHREARRSRSVTVRRGRHGMATITAHVTGLDGARIRQGLAVGAEQARAGGDRRGHQQIMADLFADALIGRGDGVDPSTLEIGVLITDRSLLAPAHADAATIEGYGSVPFEHIRDAMRHALDADGEDPELALTLRRLFLDPEDGQLVAVESRSRRFPPGLARLLRYAHQSCRAPYWDAGIRQLDHIVPWSRGGKTSRDNGNGACVADNQKEAAGRTARVITDEQGTRRTVEWTTRYGQKARRGGINYDPLGTAARQRHRRPPDASPEGTTPRASSRAEAPPGPTPRDGAEHAARIGVSLQRAVDRIDPALLVRNRHPAGPRSRDRRCRLHPHPRVDYHARRHLIVLDGDPPPTPGVPASPRT